MSVLLSYPRSGNHLVRFFIELLSEKPTLGCMENKKDIPIYLNIFPESIPFNIGELSNYKTKMLYMKYHIPPISPKKTLIFIIRNPKEVLLRHSDFQFDINTYKVYFDELDYYNKFSGKKLFLFYEDIVTKPEEFIEQIYSFLDINNPEKKVYVLNNIEKLYELSGKGLQREWGGINSDSIDFYYKQIPDSIKEQFDNYLKIQFKNEKYNFVKLKYSL